MQAGRDSLALALFDRALRRHPDDAALRNDRALTLLRMGRTSEAIDDLAAAEPADTTGVILMNLCDAMLAGGDVAGAVDEGQRAVTARPSEDGWLCYGRALAAAGSLEAAIEAFRAAGRLDPEDPLPAWNRAVLEVRAGRPDRALSLFDSLPDVPGLAPIEEPLARASAEAARGRPDRAVAPLEEAARRAEDPALADSLRAWRDLADGLGQERSRRTP